MTNKLKEELDKPVVKYGIFAGVLLLLVQHVLVPWVTWRSEIVDELHVKSGMLVSPEELESAISDITIKSEGLSSELTELRKKFPKDSQSKVKLPTKIRAVFNEFKVKVNRVSINELDTPLVGLNLYGVSVEASGSVDNLFALVSKLESDDLFFIVDRLTVYGRKGQVMKVRMELQKYVQQ